MKKEIFFDLIINYIDEHIKEDAESIKKGIHKLSGYLPQTVDHCFQVLTQKTLCQYITERRLYHIGQELSSKNYLFSGGKSDEMPARRICDIALEYGFSEQSSLSRSMKTIYDCTPTDIQKGICSIPDKKCNLSELCENNRGPFTQRMFDVFYKGGDLFDCDELLLMDLEEFSSKNGIDIYTCYKIVDVAESLGIPYTCLMSACMELVEKIRCDVEYKTEIAIELGASSLEELNNICEYYSCEFTQLDSLMVDNYYKLQKNTEPKNE